VKPQRRQEIITFKVDESLREAMNAIPNRSEFIRAAILSALDSVCPMCMGTGIFTPEQRQHWEQFQKSHRLEECADCHALHLVCNDAKKTGCKTHPHASEKHP